jgi:hypothetical protein
MDKPLQNMAYGYSRVNYNGFMETKRAAPLGKGDGGLYSTTVDLHRFVRGIYDNTIISSSTLEQMFTPFKNNYGLGWFIEELYGEKVVYHPGGSLGSMSNMRSFNDGETIVINLFNSDFLLSNLVQDRLAAIALGKPWHPLFENKNDESILNSFKRFSGKYPIDGNSDFSLILEGGNIIFQESGRPRCQAYPFSENSIYIKEINTRIRFEEDEKGISRYVGLFGLFRVTGERLEQK